MVRSQKHFLYDVSSTNNFRLTPTTIKMAAVRPDVNGMSWFERNISKFRTATTTVWGPATRRDICGYSPRSWWLINQTWPPFTCSIAYSSSCVWDSNEIPMVTPTFSGSSNTVELYCENSLMSAWTVNQTCRHWPEVHMQCRISQLVYKKATRFQRLPPHFRGPATRRD